MTSRLEFRVPIKLNPYQGLKLDPVVLAQEIDIVPIKLNPYQGLKRS